MSWRRDVYDRKVPGDRHGDGAGWHKPASLSQTGDPYATHSLVIRSRRRPLAWRIRPPVAVLTRLPIGRDEWIGVFDSMSLLFRNLRTRAKF